MNIEIFSLRRSIKIAVFELCLVIVALVASSSAFAAENPSELQKSLLKLGASLDDATVVVNRIRTSNLEIPAELRQEYYVEFVRFKDSTRSTSQAIEQVRDNPTATNLYALRQQLGKVSLQLRSITLWVYLMPSGRSKVDKDNPVRAIDQSESDFGTQVFLYDLMVDDILSKLQK
ncbi:MAG: hypothetical protein V4723_07465 [Pseudomonadota bacterium]